MNTKEIEAVVTVYKCRGFFETAYTLNYSTSMISKYISNVEAELGVTLFVRGNRASSVSLGIKFVRVSDWESYTTTYFLSLKTNESRALAQFKKVVKAHLQNT